jgi:uncharacterized protein YabN with tetrapyrrole methylase and pyrophosphatase domain
VAQTIGDKLIRRHPHVFGKSSRRIADINRRWEELKRQEKPGRKSALDGLPKSLPALLRAQRMHEKLTNRRKLRLGGDGGEDLKKAWKHLAGNLKASKQKREKAAGEFLLSFSRYANASGIHAEMALVKAVKAFENSYRKWESEIKKRP